MVFKKIMACTAILSISSFALAANPFSSKLSDPLIVTGLMNTNESEISMAKLAVKKASSPEVRAFAEEMLKDHSANNKEAKELTKKLQIKPSSNIQTESQVIGEEKDMALLKMKSGKDFDRVYIDNQVNVHRKTLENLNQKLIPAAKNDELRAMLTNTAMTVKEHLKESEQIQTRLLR